METVIINLDGKDIELKPKPTQDDTLPSFDWLKRFKGCIGDTYLLPCSLPICVVIDSVATDGDDIVLHGHSV